MSPLVIDLFAGGGGASEGIRNMVCPDVVEALVRAQVGRAGRAAA